MNDWTNDDESAERWVEECETAREIEAMTRRWRWETEEEDEHEL